ncbi:MAG TPA: PA14 domain-containing protein, partial [Pyrinomonadaceae bacterium]|nr:PA14 domain-containing protein [Pyrinomonadaceae bacterium]
MAHTAQALLFVAASVSNGGRPGFAVPAFDFFRGAGYAVSDAPFAGSLPAVSDTGRGDYAAVATAAPLAQAGGLAAHWEFDEGAAATASDSTGGGNAGALVGAAWFPGKVGPGALTFDGTDDRVSIAGTPGLSAVANNFTLAFWAKPESAHQIDAQSASGYAGTSGQRYAVWPRVGDGAWGAGHAGAGVSVGTNGVSVYEHANGYMPATLVHQAALSGWTHVAVVYENRQPRLYLNGTLVRTGLTSPKNYVHAQTTDLGGQIYGHFDGALDDVRVYDRVLSADELGSLLSLARTNVALSANGGAAAVSSVYDSTRRASSVINGERTGRGGGDPAVGNWWTDGTQNSYPDWAEVTFAGDETIDEVDIYSLQDNYQTPQEPTEGMAAAVYGLIDFEVQYWTGSAWATVPGGAVTGNTKVWRRLTFAPLTTRKLRVLVTAARGSGHSRVVEVEAWRAVGQSPQAFVTGMTLGPQRADAPGWTGMKITTAGRPLSVSSLGRICVAGSTGSRDLRLVRASDNATVAAAAVSLAGCAGGRFVYAPLASPVTLDAYADYLVVSNETGGVYFYNYAGTALTTTTAASVRHGVYTTNGGLTWGPAGAAGNGYVPLNFQYTTAPLKPGTGLAGHYFDNADLTGRKLTRTDAKVDFSWNLSAPAPGMGVEEFSVRWAGTVVPRYSETYTFHTTTDDGVRLWVDGRLVIDRWQDQGTTEWSGQVALVAGREYDIRMEFYDRWHGAAAKLSWSSPSQPKEVVPQARLYPCWKTAGQSVGAFYRGALGRPPTPAELQTWAARLDSAPDFAALEGETRSLGATLFGSAEYAARNRTAREFVYDLYWAYLQRGPDQGGWDYWTSRVGPDGQAGVREALAGARELAEKARRLCGAAPSNASGGAWGSDFAAARVEPLNRTGATDAYSRNFNWGLPLLSLPGRAGLDLGLSLSYNSLVWTKEGGDIAFDADRGFPGPGFRLGFPTVQPRFYNPRIQRAGQPARYSYLLITPSGGRVELRQVGASNVYESADSSYLQLTDEGGTLLLRSADGTRLRFAPAAGEYKCVEVKDRHGNYLTADYDYDGQLANVVDTLGRAVTFNYDAYRNLVSISQPWRRADGSGSDPHLYATFRYRDITLQPSFSNLSVVGAAPGSVVSVVERVGLDDGSHYKFEYTAWGQVWRITHYAADSVTATGAPDDRHPLSSVEYNVPGARNAAAAAQSDCPRFTERRVWAENWNGDVGDWAEKWGGGSAGETIADDEQAVTTYSAWAAGLASCQVTLPDRTTVVKETYGAGWAEGLTTQSEVYALSSAGAALPATPKKKTVTEWEQDDETRGFDENPRVAETNVYDDAGNRRRTRVEYLTAADSPFRLPKKVYEYKADAATVWRRSEVDYLGPSITAAGAYAQKRLVGLVKERRLYGLDPYTGAEKLLSKATYAYDEGGEHLVSPRDSAGSPVNPVRHDPAYGTAYTTRGLVTGVRRWDADAPADQTKSVESRAGYDTCGSVVFTADASGHKSTADYADRFSDGVNRNAFAYPTAAADPEQSALAQPKKALTTYDFDRGLVTKTKDLKDSERTFTYDAANRLKEATVVFNGAKVRYEYPASMTYVHAYSKAEADKAEGHSWSVLDGAGRVIGTASDHPDPVRTQVRYSGRETFYDVMGRAFKQSNPAEIDGTWLPQGDDAAGWRYATQTFDWQGRPLRVTNADGATYREFSYGGCGCAGGQTVLARDEVGRRRKVSYDVLGRVAKTQDLTAQAKNLPLSSAADGGDVYRTTSNLYNGRDQAVETLAHAGAAAPTDQTKIQKTTLAYDGHGRLKSRHLPRQGAGKATTFEYHADDTLWKVTDARGSLATHAYDKRHLL